MLPGTAILSCLKRAQGQSEQDLQYMLDIFLGTDLVILKEIYKGLVINDPTNTLITPLSDALESKKARQ